MSLKFAVRAPRRAPDPRAPGRRLLGDGAFPVVNHAAGRDARAQQRQPHPRVVEKNRSASAADSGCIQADDAPNPSIRCWVFV